MLEKRFTPKPFETYPQSLWGQRRIPSWVQGEYALVETIGGFLLSLRSDIAKQNRFDETLGYGIGYALLEDMELSLRLQNRGHLLIAAHDAPIYHAAHPGLRAGGFNYGFCWIANCIYATRRNIPDNHMSLSKHLLPFLKYKIALYAARKLLRADDHSRKVLAGASLALRESAALMDCPEDSLSAVYKAFCDRHLVGPGVQIATSGDRRAYARHPSGSR